MHDIQQQLIKDLVVESIEGLDQFDQDLLALESNQSNEEILHRIFRTIHTVKGSSGCLGLRRIEKVAHAGENLLSLMRDGRLQPNPELMSKLFSYADCLRQMFTILDATGIEGEEDYDGLITALNALHTSVVQAESSLHHCVNATSTKESSHPTTALTGVFGMFADESEAGRQQKVSPAPPETVAPSLVGVFGLFTEEEPASTAAATLVNEKVEGAIDPASAPNASATKPTAPTSAPREQAQQGGSASSAESAIRIDVTQLDTLMDLVGELVLARNQIVQYAGVTREPSLLNSTQRLNIITTKLQENVMKTRMQPIGNVWGKFPRIVRDLSMELMKCVSLVMEGQETELDRTILDAIKDPLTHVVRNAIDHGLERPEIRAAAGKPAEGQLKLRAFHEGGQVIIEISDDGGGIDRDRVLRKALDKGLISADQANRMSEREILGLVFLPGFSTAEKVTSISGRGVGMDVVKNNIERIGGTVDIESERGRSTTIRIKIPLTLAIIPALMICCADARYAIPQASLVELVRIDEEQASKSVEYIGSCPVYRLRGNLLPLVDLREQLQLGPKPSTGDQSIFLLVLQAEGRQFGLVVDSILDTEEIVVKPLGKELKHVTTYAGATIMGDGRVALILDIIGIARRANVLQDSAKKSLDSKKGEFDRHQGEKQTLLLVGTGGGRQAAIPLSAVSRLEELQTSEIELAGNSEVVQYRGEIMSLLRISQLLGHASTPDGSDKALRVVVYALEHHSFGLVVDHIIDIVDSDTALQRCKNRPGILGSAVVQGKVTDFLDIPTLIESSGVTTFAA